jgi:hypothetical protein
MPTSTNSWAKKSPSRKEQVIFQQEAKNVDTQVRWLEAEQEGYEHLRSARLQKQIPLDCRRQTVEFSSSAADRSEV